VSTRARRPARLALATATLVASALGASQARAEDPDVEWRTIHTQHFRVHHWRSLERVAERVAIAAEDVHERLTRPLGHTPSMTDIVLSDDTDAANGSAIALPYNTIRLYVTAPEDLSTLGDYDDWLLMLVAHEYVHVLHTDNMSGLPSVANAVLGKTLAPNQVQPRWILEGLATAFESSSSSGGRVRSSLFDAYLRADFLEGNVARLDQLSSAPFRWPQGNIWYLYGSRFLAWIGEVYGENALRATVTDYGQWIVPWGINRSIRRVTGRTYVELYEGFKDHTKRRYEAQVAALEKRGLREGTRLTFHGRDVTYPRFVPKHARTKPDALELVYHRNNQRDRSGVYRATLDRATGKLSGDELVARTNADSTSTFTPDGGLVFSTVVPWKNWHARHDLFFLPKGETSVAGWERSRKRLTRGLRASQADVHGRDVVFSQNHKGTSYLEIATLPRSVGNEAALPAGELEGVRTLVPSSEYDQVYTPRFSPDGKKVAYSVWTSGGYRDVRIVDVATGRFENVTNDRALDLEPVWSADGKTLYFASDRTGIFNIYAYSVEQRSLAQVTNVRTLAVMPAPSDDGKSLVYVGYTSAGYDLFHLPLDPSKFLPAEASYERPAPRRVPAVRPAMKKTGYAALPTIGPRAWLFSLGPGRFGPLAATLTTKAADAVGLHSMTASLVVDPLAPQPDFSLSYAYSRLQPTLSLSVATSSVPRTGYQVSGVERPYVERSVTGSAALSLPLRGDFFNQQLGLSFNVVSFWADAPLGKTLDPNLSPPTKGASGLLNLARLSYGFSNVEGSLDTPGSIRGFSAQVGVEYADNPTGSQASLYLFDARMTAYVPMPFLKQTLGLRAGYGTAGGTYSRDGVFAIGGYDASTADPLRTVTSGFFASPIVLRGYAPGKFTGRNFLSANLEYRAPIVQPDRGLSTLPIYVRRIDAAAFADMGGAFNRINPETLGFFRNDSIIDAPELHSSVGLELWLGLTVGYVVNTQLRFGYAKGFDGFALPDGQFYFVGSAAY
jgi:hypothetical protein